MSYVRPQLLFCAHAVCLTTADVDPQPYPEASKITHSIINIERMGTIQAGLRTEGFPQIATTRALSTPECACNGTKGENEARPDQGNASLDFNRNT